MNDIVRKKRRKFILILIVIFIIAILLSAFAGVIDYFRAISGKKPLFIYHTANVESFDVEIAGFEDSTLTNEKSSNYYGLWYMVSVCDTENKNYHFQLGHDQKTLCREGLTCTKTFAENDIHNFDYSFFDNKLVKIDTTLTIPSNQIVNAKTYEKEFMKINDIAGCNGTFNKLNDETYITYQTCNISKMSDEDIQSIYISDRKSLVQSKDKVIESYAIDKDMICN